jgi:hypothetical protein
MRRWAALRAWLCILAAVAAVPVLPSRRAEAMVSTDQAITEVEAGQVASERQRLLEAISRADVRAQMIALGVSPDEAAQRVATMSDQEVHRVAGHLDTLPAGGDAIVAVVGAAVLIFVILLLTDIFGLTKIFPWTRSIR